MSRPKTESEKMSARTKRANRKHKADLDADAALHERVRRGELTAAEAFLSKAKGKMVPR